MSERIKQSTLDGMKQHLAETLAGGARIFSCYPANIKDLLDEIDRLHDIESHLCMVVTDGKFSHFEDDRQPERKAKFDAAVQSGFNKVRALPFPSICDHIDEPCDC